MCVLGLACVSVGQCWSHLSPPRDIYRSSMSACLVGVEKGSWRRPLAMVARACDAIGEEPTVMAPRSLGMMKAILLVEILASNP